LGEFGPLDSNGFAPQNWENWKTWTMQNPMIPNRIVVWLIVGAVFLPITLCVIMGVAALLEAMGDSLGGAVLQRVALAGGIVWIIELICLLLVLAIGALRRPDDADEP
jgi:hypothetical protein